MPRNANNFRKNHNKKLSKKESAKAASVANAVLKKTGDEGKAIRIANAQAKKKRRSMKAPLSVVQGGLKSYSSY